MSIFFPSKDSLVLVKVVSRYEPIADEIHKYPNMSDNMKNKKQLSWADLILDNLVKRQ